MEERVPKAGDHVVYTDAFGVSHNTVVTHGWTKDVCNLVYVGKDVNKSDTYGNQIERDTSVQKKHAGSAPGKFWQWPDEV